MIKRIDLNQQKQLNRIKALIGAIFCDQALIAALYIAITRIFKEIIGNLQD
ncbi:hypothetical protein FMO003_41280 [Moritella sp. F3]|nr:hypothetical protein FMO001_05700 [Moritella sp. F1]GIC83848.1 hypothetical protein FMO003_41280 [Moritella sp. F3]